jgi:hypothetical protein
MWLRNRLARYGCKWESVAMLRVGLLRSPVELPMFSKHYADTRLSTANTAA